MSNHRPLNRPSKRLSLGDQPSENQLGDRLSDHLPRFLTALPVYNEAAHLSGVLDEVTKYAADVLAVDDGSTDGTSKLLADRDDVHVIHHPSNLGYGAALQTAFKYALDGGYEVLLTIDCDRQHEPQRIRQLVAACQPAAPGPRVDIVSGSRYLQESMPEQRQTADGGGFRNDLVLQAPEGRRRINMQITQELNLSLGLELTDAFCGFKAYRVESLARLRLTESGYAMPLELWVQAARLDLRIIELPVPLIYLEEERSFGGALDDGATRLDYYRTVINRAVARCRHDDFGKVSGGNAANDSASNVTETNIKLCESGARQCS
jgi:glycosyltransferase involved in cell wall biosynthesis